MINKFQKLKIKQYNIKKYIFNTYSINYRKIEI